MNKTILVSLSGLLLVLAFVLATYFYKSHQVDKITKLATENNEPFVRKHSQSLGPEDAKVTLVEFFDPACETCSAFHRFVKDILAQYPGKIKLVVRYAPFHQGADYFVKILEAARNQGMYWETLEIMFQTQQYWANHHNPKPELIWGFLKETKLDLKRIKSEMQSSEIARIIKQDLEDAATLNVTKTPGFFVNGKPLITFGYRHLRDLIETEIKANY